MSNKALTWAFEQDIKSGPKFVLVALADYADERDSCYPSYKKLSAKTGFKERAIANHMVALEEAGLIRREELRYDDGRRSGFRFFLNLQNLQVAENDVATCKKRRSHLQNMQDNNPYNNPHTNPQRARDEKQPSSDTPEKPNSEPSPPDDREMSQPKTQTKRRGLKWWEPYATALAGEVGRSYLSGMGDAKQCAEWARRYEVEPETVAGALLAFYRDPAERARNHHPKVSTALSDERFAAFIESPADPTPKRAVIVDDIAEQEARMAAFMADAGAAA